LQHQLEQPHARAQHQASCCCRACCSCSAAGCPSGGGGAPPRTAACSAARAAAAAPGPPPCPLHVSHKKGASGTGSSSPMPWHRVCIQISLRGGGVVGKRGLARSFFHWGSHGRDDGGGGGGSSMMARAHLLPPSPPSSPSLALSLPLSLSTCPPRPPPPPPPPPRPPPPPPPPPPNTLHPPPPPPWHTLPPPTPHPPPTHTHTHTHKQPTTPPSLQTKPRSPAVALQHALAVVVVHAAAAVHRPVFQAACQEERRTKGVWGVRGGGAHRILHRFRREEGGGVKRGSSRLRGEQKTADGDGGAARGAEQAPR
jgi:hypothetical protein